MYVANETYNPLNRYLNYTDFSLSEPVSFYSPY